MAPKKVMKTMKKKTDLEKSPQKKKGLEKPSNQRGLEKSSGRKGLEKPMKKPSCNDGDGLEKPGTIKDKVKAAAEEAEGDADQGAAILHGSLSKLDKSKGTRPWKRPMPNLARRRKELLLANGSWKRKASSFSKPPGGFLWEKLSLRLGNRTPNAHQVHLRRAGDASPVWKGDLERVPLHFWYL